METKQTKLTSPFPLRSVIFRSLRWGLFATLISALFIFVPVIGYIYLMIALYIGSALSAFTIRDPYCLAISLVVFTVIFGAFRFAHLYYVHYSKDTLYELPADQHIH
jgi:prepilin signal peptidase PulO-like enzyme (type II secretory pathway)